MRLLFLLAEGGEEHAEAFLGLPIWLWQILNLALFFGLLAYYAGRPVAKAFRKRQEEVEQRRRKAEQLRAEALRLEAEIQERMGRLEHEVAQIRAQGAADGEAEKKALAERADQEAERILQGSQEEIERRVAAARAQLRAAASDLTGMAATEILSREITDEDRRRLLTESASRLKDAR